MNKDTKISSIQLFLLMAGYIYGSTSIMNSAFSVGADAWIAFIMGWIGGFGIMTLYVMLYKLNPSQTLIEMLQNNFGKLLGNIIAVSYIWYFIHLSALVYRNFGEFIVTVTYPETPMIVIIAFLASLAAYSTKNGFEVGARIAELFVPIIPIVVALVFFSFNTSSDFTAMLPVLENGLAPVMKTAYSILTFPFGEAVAFLMIYPFLNKYKNISKVSYLAVAVSGGLLLIALTRDLIVLGPDLITEISYPVHATSRLLPGIGIEPLIDLVFMIGGGVKTGILIFSAALGITQIFKLDDYKPLVIPIVTFSVLISVWIYPSRGEMVRWATDIYPYYSISYEFTIPLLLLIVSLIRHHFFINIGEANNR